MDRVPLFRAVTMARHGVTLAVGAAPRLRDLAREAAAAMAPVVVLSFARPAEAVAADLGQPEGKVTILGVSFKDASARPASELDALLAEVQKTSGAVVVETLAQPLALYGAEATERFVRALAAQCGAHARALVLLAPRGASAVDAARASLETLVDRTVEV